MMHVSRFPTEKWKRREDLCDNLADLDVQFDLNVTVGEQFL